MRRTVLSAAVVCLVVSLALSLEPTGRVQAQKATPDLLLSVPDSQSFWWSPDAKTLAVSVLNVETKSGGLVLYDVALGKPRVEIKNMVADTPSAGSFTPDGRTFILHTDRVRLYDAGDGKLMREFGQGTEPVRLYRKIFVPVKNESYDSNTGTYTTTWDDPSDKEELMELPTRYLSDRVVSPDGKSLLVRAPEGKAQVYDLGTGELKFTLEPVADAPLKKYEKGYGDALGEFSPDGKLIVTTHRNRTPRLWNAATGALVADLAPQSGAVMGARFSADGKFVATSTFRDGVVRIWEAATGKFRRAIGSAQDPNYFAAWNPGNNTFVTKTPKWEVNIWDAETGALVAQLDRKAAKEKFDKNLTFVYCPYGRILVTEARAHDSVWSIISPLKKLPFVAHLWDAATGKLITSLRDTRKRRLEITSRQYFWTPAGDYLVTAGVAVQVWRRSGELAHDLDINALVMSGLSPDGKLLAFTSDNNTLGALMSDVAKLFIGKLPKFKLPPTHVWQVETN